MTSRVRLALLVLVGMLGGCATPPVPVSPRLEAPAPIALPPATAPLVEYPPIEPVEPPLVPAPAPAPQPSESVTPPAPPPTPAAVVAPPAPPEPSEDQEIASLLSDLNRYGALAPDDLRRELNGASQLLARQRTDINRVRLAVLYTLAKSTPQDDQRALQLLENVARNNPGSPAVKQLAAVLQVQVAERVRAVRDEQQKGETAVKKLEALRMMERDLLRDRIRSGGGGAGGGSSGGGGGGGGGG